MRRGNAPVAGTDMWIPASPASRPARRAPSAAARALRRFLRQILGAGRDLAPLIGVVAFFQFVIFRQPLPEWESILLGLLFVVLGLALFVHGLETSLFPIGEDLANALTAKASVPWLLMFAFGLGFGTTIAEPALIAVAGEAGKIAAEAGMIEPSAAAIEDWSDRLRQVVAVSVGSAIMLGVIRIICGWPIHLIVIAGYLVVLAMTAVTPAEFVGIAYDAGGVTTSTITVPLVAALGVGLSTGIRGRSPVTDGFGMIALASLFPIIFVLGFGIVS